MATQQKSYKAGIEKAVEQDSANCKGLQTFLALQAIPSLW